MSDDGDVDPKVWQRVAESELASATHSRNVLLEAHQDAYKWLLASLLAVNSGGMLALLNVDNLRGLTRSLVAASFFSGILSALLSAYLSQRANRLLLGPLGEAMGYWIQVAHSGEHLGEVWKPIEDRIQAAVRGAWPTQFCGWVSVVCFSIGVVTLAVDLSQAR